MEAWKLHVWTIIVSGAFINNWVDFLFVETPRDGGHWQITSFPAGTRGCRQSKQQVYDLMANIRAESPLKAGCICGLKREWHDLRKPWTFAFELFWRTVRTAQVEYYATDRVFVWRIF